MSIDEMIGGIVAGLAANTAATEKNTGILERVLEGQAMALARHDASVKDAGAARKRETAAEKKAREAAESAGGDTATVTVEVTEAAHDATVHPLLASPNGAMSANAKGEDTPTANYRASSFDLQEVKNEFIGWLGEAETPEDRKPRVEFVAAMGQHFGVGKPFDAANGLKDEEHFKQALFFLRRSRAGVSVDFGAEYDFDGDPAARSAVVQAEEEDPLG